MKQLRLLISYLGVMLGLFLVPDIALALQSSDLTTKQMITTIKDNNKINGANANNDKLPLASRAKTPKSTPPTLSPSIFTLPLLSESLSTPIQEYRSRNGIVDNTSVVDNAASSYAKPSANQDAFKEQQVKDSQQIYNHNLFIPLRPDKDLNMNINQQQIQINIKY